MALSKEARDALPDGDFAVPGKRALPMHDETHVRMAWNMVDKTKDLTDAERSEARTRIKERAKKLGIDTSQWNMQAMTLEAMSVELPVVNDHPNRMPFSGIMTRLDEPSDLPLAGSSGKRVILPTHVAEEALPSLLGMAVDVKDKLDGHDPTRKVGIITEARIEGNAIHISGFIYAADFPREAKRIQAEKSRLGFSYEVQAAIESLEAPIWVISSCKFTGAAILYKDKAAYQTTSLAAQSEIDMNPEELKKLNDSIAALAAGMEGIKKEVADLKSGKADLNAGSVHHLVKPHADKLRGVADGMEAAGIGGHPDAGHVKILRHMADSMEAAATMGKIPHIYRDHDFLSASSKRDDKAMTELDGKVTKLEAAIGDVLGLVKDMQKAQLTASQAPERKTISIPAGTRNLLAKGGLKLDGTDENLTVEKVDQILDTLKLPVAKRLAAKFELQAAGLLASN